MKNRLRQSFLGIGLLLCINVSAAAGLPPLTSGLTPIKHAPSAPSLKLKNLDDDIIDISDLRGKVVIVNFWATWCPPCRREMGSLERLYQLTKHEGVELLAVNVGEDVDTVFSFLGVVEPSPTFQILFDSDGVLMPEWDVKGLPTTFIIDKQGKRVYRAVGGREFDHPDIKNAVLKLAVETK